MSKRISTRITAVYPSVPQSWPQQGQWLPRPVAGRVLSARHAPGALMLGAAPRATASVASP